MAKLTGPLMSEVAHGKLAQSLIYSSRKEGNIGRRFHMPDKEITLKQWTQRHIIGLLTAHWQVKSAAEKQVYEDLVKASGLQISGFNYFIKVAQADLYTHHGLCGYWSMNEETGAQVTDYSGQGNHGTLMPTYPSYCPTRVAAMLKQYGKALSFDGWDDNMDCGNDASLYLTHTGTVEAWIKSNSFTEGQFPTVINIGNFGGSLNGYRIYHQGGHPITNFKAEISNASRYNVTYFCNITAGNWYHLVMTWDGSKLRAYVNGILTGETNQNLDVAATGSLTISHPTYAFNGLIDEVHIYNRALSTDEIKKHYELLRLDKKRQPLLIH